MYEALHLKSRNLEAPLPRETALVLPTHLLEHVSPRPHREPLKYRNEEL